MNKDTKINLIDKYSLELNEDTKVDRFNLMDKQMMLPAIKHKWVARFINHKQSLYKLKKLKDVAKEKIVAGLKKDSEVILNKITLNNMAENSELIEGINKKIEMEELTILYLEKVESIFRSMSYDMSSLVELIKLEET